MFIRMLKLPDEVRARYDLSSPAGASSTPPRRARSPVKEQMIEWWGPVIHEYYAGTEGNGFVYCNSEDWLAHPGTVGHGRSLGTIHIVDDDGDELPDRRGRAPIYFEGGADVRVPQRPREDGRTRATPTGWSTLGDIGYLDDDGYLYLTDRKAYMIISGGVNIYPQEAENVLVDAPEGASTSPSSACPTTTSARRSRRSSSPSTWPTPAPSSSAS